MSAKRTPRNLSPIDEPDVQDEHLDEEDLVLPFTYSITCYGADYPVDGLVKRMKVGDIFIPPFQRGYVWPQKQAHRFIESLLLGLPVPAIFLSKERGTGKLLVIDGQQRLRTLVDFYRGISTLNKGEFKLKGVQPQFEGKTYETLEAEDRRRLDDSIIHAIIVKQEEPSDDDSSIYHVFERLNTGGTLLQPQEIRACIYHGELNALLVELNKNSAWRSIVGPEHKNKRDQELILRFLALYFFSDEYSRPMKQFLNRYMGTNRHLERQSADVIRKAFVPSIELAHAAFAGRPFRLKGPMNAAIFDSVLIGLARRLEKGEVRQPEAVNAAYASLTGTPDFLRCVERATADEANVKMRLELATKAFATVP